MSPRIAARLALVRVGFLLGRLAGSPRPRVVLATSHARAIGGNLAALRAELATRSPRVPVATIAFQPSSSLRGLATAALASIRAGYHLASARAFVVDDYFLPMYVVRPRAGTTCIQVWHASGAFKKFGYSVLDKGFGQTEAEVAQVPIHTNYDYCLVSSMRFAPAYAEAFNEPLDRFHANTGIPRTDQLFGERRDAAEAAVRAAYPAIAGKRSVLYAPTFRGESALVASQPVELDLHELRASLGDDHVILLRQHPFVRRSTALGPDLEGFVIDVSDHPDIHELMLVSDVLVSDYSSAIYEYSLLGRPMAFFAPDLEAYEGERGFYFDYRSGVPGPVFETTTALAAWLRAGDFDLERVARFRDESFDVADGHASRRFVDEVLLPALEP
ncbi:MAG TPA: CDP-glycerol glycerophosphotransferase family protein [Candidatus Limnocylindrales bacterium]|nr:CDP-glycerol glycerophosphotransferase family protein [Candidatus Limnocylindrales bacterium]